MDFMHSFLLFQNKLTLNFNNTDLPEDWYNSYIVASIFNDCLKIIDECILRQYLLSVFMPMFIIPLINNVFIFLYDRGKVKSFVQKLLDKKSVSY